jgi:hypothetical protein
MTRPVHPGRYFRGHLLSQDSEGRWRYEDGDLTPPAGATRACALCHQHQLPEGYDPCLGFLPTAAAACCGHGILRGYLAFWDGTYRSLPKLMDASEARQARERALYRVDRSARTPGSASPVGGELALSRRRSSRLLLAIDSYDRLWPRHDGVLLSLMSHIQNQGFANREDVLRLARWTRLRSRTWYQRVVTIPAEIIVRVTRNAFVATRKGGLPLDLAELFGTRNSVAEAVLTAMNPREYGIRGRYAARGLGQLLRDDRMVRAPYGQYLEMIRAFRDELTLFRPHLTSREVDKGLYVIGIGCESLRANIRR